MGIGFFELVVVGFIAFLVLRPEDWLNLAYKVGKLFRYLKSFKQTLKKTYQPLLEEIELEDIAKQAKKKALKE
jgi:Sec-independent protein translocase protein TatA